jgi:hypothetical protein
MQRISPAKAALSIGLVLGLYHLSWVTLVVLGAAKPVMDFVLKLHFIKLSYEIAPFVASTAASLVALTFAVGAVFGLVFALIWNRLTNHRDAKPRELSARTSNPPAAR